MRSSVVRAPDLAMELATSCGVSAGEATAAAPASTTSARNGRRRTASPLKVKLRGQTTTPDHRRRRTLYFRDRGAPPQARHGPIKRIGVTDPSHRPKQRTIGVFLVQ